MLAVVKMRTSAHDRSICRYAIESSGVVVGRPVHGHGGVLTGVPFVRAEAAVGARPGLTREETTLLEKVVALGEGDARAVARASGMKGRL